MLHVITFRSIKVNGKKLPTPSQLFEAWLPATTAYFWLRVKSILLLHTLRYSHMHMFIILQLYNIIMLLIPFDLQC